MENSSLARQVPYSGISLQKAATTTGAGTTADVSGIHGALVVELLNAGTGSGVGTLIGSYDKVTWYGIRYAVLSTGTAGTPTAPIAPTAAPSTAVTAITVAAAGSAGAAQLVNLLDYYPFVQFNIATANAGVSLSVTLHGLPV